MTDCVYFLLYLALGKLSLMLLINYIYFVCIVFYLLHDSRNIIILVLLLLLLYDIMSYIVFLCR